MKHGSYFTLRRHKSGVGLVGRDTNARLAQPVTYAEISSGTEVGRTKPSCPRSLQTVQSNIKQERARTRAQRGVGLGLHADKPRRSASVRRNTRARRRRAGLTRNTKPEGSADAGHRAGPPVRPRGAVCRPGVQRAKGLSPHGPTTSVKASCIGLTASSRALRGPRGVYGPTTSVRTPCIGPCSGQARRSDP